MDQAGGRGATWRAKHTATVANLILISHTQGWPLLHTHAPQPELPNQSTHTKPNQTTTKDDRPHPSSMILIFMLRQSPFPPVPVQFDFILPLLCRSAAQSLDHPLSRFITFVLSRLWISPQYASRPAFVSFAERTIYFLRHLCDIWYIYTTALSLDIILSTSLYPYSFVQHS